MKGSEPYDPDNLLDRLVSQDTLEAHYAWMLERERAILSAAFPREGGDVLSVGAGWFPGRHLFPAPDWRLTAVDADPDKPHTVVEEGRADAGFVGRAGELGDLDDASFDAVLYRLVLHHVVFQQPLAPVFAEAARLLRPGGVLVAIEPGLLHPVGAGLALANKIGLGTKVHGTPDDIPLAPKALIEGAEQAGLQPELHAVSYGWRRLPPRINRALHPLDERLGSRPRAARLGHTLMLVATKP